MMRLLLMFLALCACSQDKKGAQDPAADARVGEVRAQYDAMVEAAARAAVPPTGWLLPDDCDGMIWEGQRSAAVKDDPGTVELAEYPDQPGRFSRRPVPCWTPEEGDVGSQTTWSRDMAAAGLLPYAWLHGKRDLLERHAAYGRGHPQVFEGFPAWRMGEPLADGRVVYTPAVIGVVYQLIYALGGADNPNRLWPNVYTKGLTGYTAHLQVMDIWTRGDAAQRMGDMANAPAPPVDPNAPETQVDGGGEPSYFLAPALVDDISGTMFKRLQEQAAREPTNVLFQAVYGKYSGNMAPAIDALLAGTVGDYVSCGGSDACALAQRMFAARIILDAFHAF